MNSGMARCSSSVGRRQSESAMRLKSRMGSTASTIAVGASERAVTGSLPAEEKDFTLPSLPKSMTLLSNTHRPVHI